MTARCSALYAVVGRPIAHSQSPAMHNSAFRALGIPVRYGRLTAGSAREALQKARALGVQGLNVTAPFKEEFARYCDWLDRTARTLGAVNTVVFQKGRALGYNTDVYGVAQALRSHQVVLKGRKAVVLGAGGAARAATFVLVTSGAEVTVASRTVSKARAIAEAMGCRHSSLQPPALKRIFQGAGIVVSAVSTAKRIVPPGLLNGDQVILEANYATRTALKRDAEESGVEVIDGREWLLFQGAKAFEIFTRRKAPIDAMRMAVYSGQGRGVQRIRGHHVTEGTSSHRAPRIKAHLNRT